MLTGKKISVLLLNVVIVLVAFLPVFKLEAATAFDAPSNTITDTGFYGGINVSTVQSTYTANPTVNTRNLGTGAEYSNYYYVTDGVTYGIYKKGTPDVAGQTIRDDSKDTMIGVINSDGKYRDLLTPIPKTDIPAQTTAFNMSENLAGNGDAGANYDVYNSVFSKDDSAGVVTKEQQETRALQNEQKALQAQLDANGMLDDADQERLDELNKIVPQMVQNTTDRKGTESMDSRAEENRPIPPPDKIYCFNFLNFGGPSLNWPGCAAIVGNWAMSVAAFFLWMAANLFDLTLSITLNFKKLVTDLKVIEVGWGIFRDVSNIFFIFLLLAAAIGTIIGNGKYNAKAMIPSILMAAVLINFSLFFTKVIIDSSNIMALQFYAHMGGTTTGNPYETKVANGSTQATGIAAIFLESMNLKTLYTMSSTNVPSNVSAGSAGTAAQSAGITGANLSAANIALVGVGGTILFLVTTFVLLAAIFLFIARTLILVFLMATSPIAFMSMAIPGGPLKNIGKEWWETLWKQVFFAPIYMAMMYIAVLAVKNLGATSGTAAGSFASMFNGNGSSTNVVFTFIMIIGFMILALMSAVKFGAMGSSSVMGAGKKITGWSKGALKGAAVGTAGFAAREVLGGAAYSFGNSNAMRAIAARMPGGGLIKAGMDKVGGAKFGTSKGYGERAAKSQKDRESLAEFTGGVSAFRSQGRLESGTTYEAKRKAYETKQKTASVERKNATMKVTVDADGKFVSSSTPLTATSQADVRGFREAQQKHIDNLKKKGKQAVDKVARKNSYLENVEDLVGKDTMETHFGAEYKKKNLEPADIADFKQKIGKPAGGAVPGIPYATGSKLHELERQIGITEGLIGNAANTPGDIARESTKLNNLYKRKEALEEKIVTHLDAVDKMQQDAATT
ncbi:MAG: hypothetical protein V4664_01800 [Patescibacteria group bacterium]